MKFELKEKKSYLREVLDAVQTELGRTNIGIEGNEESFILTKDGKELNLTASEEARIKALKIIKEKLE